VKAEAQENIRSISNQVNSNLAPGNMDVKTTTTCKVGKVFNIE